MVAINLILKALDIICESRLWQDAKPSEVLNILLYMNGKRWLYTSQSAMCGAYRTREGDNLDDIPLKEEGNILYVPFVISFNKDDNIYKDVREITRKYLKNNSDIKVIILQDKNDKLRRYKIGEYNGQFEKADITNTANTSH